MKRIMVFVAALLCTAPVLAAKKDVSCDKLAEFSRSIANLKSTGITLPDVQQFVSEPTVAPFPVQSVKTQVYELNLTPDATYTTMYSRCIIVGYENTLGFFKNQEETSRALRENMLLKQENALLRDKVTELNSQVQDLMFPPMRTKSNVRAPVTQSRPVSNLPNTRTLAIPPGLTRSK